MGLAKSGARKVVTPERSPADSPWLKVQQRYSALSASKALVCVGLRARIQLPARDLSHERYGVRERLNRLDKGHAEFARAGRSERYARGDRYIVAFGTSAAQPYCLSAPTKASRRRLYSATIGGVMVRY